MAFDMEDPVDVTEPVPVDPTERVVLVQPLRELVFEDEPTVETQFTFMDDVPIKQYTFIYHFNDGERSGGGMEHRDSAAIHVGIRQGVRSVETQEAES